MNNEEERSNNAKPSNPGADSDQTQAAKASGDGNWIGRVVSRCHSSGRKKQQCKSPITQVVKASGNGSRIGCVVSCHHSSGGEEHAGLENGKKIQLESEGKLSEDQKQFGFGSTLRAPPFTHSISSECCVCSKSKKVPPTQSNNPISDSAGLQNLMEQDPANQTPRPRAVPVSLVLVSCLFFLFFFFFNSFLLCLYYTLLFFFFLFLKKKFCVL